EESRGEEKRREVRREGLGKKKGVRRGERERRGRGRERDRREEKEVMRGATHCALSAPQRNEVSSPYWGDPMLCGGMWTGDEGRVGRLELHGGRSVRRNGGECSAV